MAPDAIPSVEDDLTVVEDPRLDDDGDEFEDADDRADPSGDARPADSDLESLRNEFVAAFNSRDIDAVLAVVATDVDCPDIQGEGLAALSEEIESIWERSPGAILTRADLEGTPVAVGWLPDEDGCWSRAALVCFDCADGLLSLVAMPEDADALDRAQAEDPTGEELDEWSDWSEWDRGEETVSRRRDRARP